MVHPKIVKVDEVCLLCQLNDTWVYVIDVEGEGIRAQYRIEGGG